MRSAFSFFGIALLAAALPFAPASASIKTETIEYKQGDTILEGYLAYDTSAKGKRPGVVIVHDWMGLRENTMNRAKQMAQMGYIAFAADIYGKTSRPKDQKEASAFAGKYKGDRALLRARVGAALDVLTKNPKVDVSKLLSMGYCFGGTTALELARSGSPIKGTVVFHGNLDTPNLADASKIKGKVLVLTGADDPYVTKEQIATFEKEMRDAGVDWQLTEYGGAVHSFTIEEAGNDPKKGAAYNAAADKRSFEAMKNFFAEVTR